MKLPRDMAATWTPHWGPGDEIPEGYRLVPLYALISPADTDYERAMAALYFEVDFDNRPRSEWADDETDFFATMADGGFGQGAVIGGRKAAETNELTRAQRAAQKRNLNPQ